MWVKGLSTVLFVETAAGTIDRAVQEIVELAGTQVTRTGVSEKTTRRRAHGSPAVFSLNNSQVGSCP